MESWSEWVRNYWRTDRIQYTMFEAGLKSNVNPFIFIYIQNIHNKRAMTALGRSPEYHWNQIISKSVHRFSRRNRLKLSSIYSPGGHFVQHSGTVWAIFVDSHLRNISVELIQNPCSGLRRRSHLKVFLFLALAAILFNGVEQFEQF